MAPSAKPPHVRFNLAVMDLLNILKQKFPRDSTIGILRMQFSDAVAIDDTLPYKTSRADIAKWRNHIIVGDEKTFLTTSDYPKDLEPIVKELRLLWKKFSPAEISIIKSKLAAIAMID